jgi:predicted ATPase
LLYGDDPGVGCLSYIALVLWFLGYADQARQRMQAALTLARDLAHPFSLAYALIAAAWLHQYRREAQASQTYAAEAIALSREQGIALREAQGTIMGGWALAAQGEGEAGIAQMQQGLAAFHATGAVLNRTYYLFLLAEAYAQRGQTEEGLCALTEALDGVQSGRERWWEAELHRLSGDLLLAQTGTNQQLVEVEQCFRRAVGIAQQQQAKSLELRATMSLGRLWQRQGKRSEAYALLAPVYGWFTEGFDTADLQEAKTLLEELKG